MFFRSGDAVTEGNEVRFRTLNPSYGFSPQTVGTRSFSVYGDMGSFLESYSDGEIEYPKIATTDFDGNYLVAIHQGLCPTGGYSVRVVSVRARLDTVTVTVDFQEPGPDDIVTMAMTTPRLFLLVPRRKRVSNPLFRFRAQSGEIFAERRPTYGKAAPNGGNYPKLRDGGA